MVRGQGAIFPNTYNGYPVWLPPAPGETIAMRYWSMCNNNQASPYPVIECAADWATNLDEQGYYTYVVSDADEPPAWVPPTRNMAAVGVEDRPQHPDLPEHAAGVGLRAVGAGRCRSEWLHVQQPIGVPDALQRDCRRRQNADEKVMGAYYPVAAYCDKALFISKGWQGCFAAAGMGPRT